jgi:hypothetical protein
MGRLMPARWNHALRCGVPPGGRAVTFDEVMDALRSLDDDPPPRPGGKSQRLVSGPLGPDPSVGGNGASPLG